MGAPSTQVLNLWNSMIFKLWRNCYYCSRYRCRNVCLQISLTNIITYTGYNINISQHIVNISLNPHWKPMPCFWYDNLQVWYDKSRPFVHGNMKSRFWQETVIYSPDTYLHKRNILQWTRIVRLESPINVWYLAITIKLPGLRSANASSLYYLAFLKNAEIPIIYSA